MRVLFVILLTLSIKLSSWATAPEKWTKLAAADSVELLVPSHYTLNEKSPLDDFTFVQILDGELVIFSFYIGDHPSFPSEASTPTTQSKTANGYLKHSALGAPDTSILKEMLIELGEKSPKYAHFGIRKEMASRLEIMETIVDSIRVLNSD